MPQFITLERYLLVAYSLQIFASPPMTLWQLAACSLAEPSPGFTAYTILPTSVSFTETFSFPEIVLMAANTFARSGSNASSFSSPSATLAFSNLSTSLVRPTYSGSLLDKVNSASPSGLER